MFKQATLLKRRPGMTVEEFRTYYETKHSKIAEKALTLARRYVRRYVTPAMKPFTNEPIELDFDVVMEIWWESKEDFETNMKQIAGSDLLQAILDDEKNLFLNFEHPRVFTVEEDDSVLPRS